MPARPSPSMPASGPNISVPMAVRRIGTNRSWITNVLLRVARMPLVNQTSSTVTSCIGSTTNRVSNCGPSTTVFTIAQSA